MRSEEGDDQREKQRPILWRTARARGIRVLLQHHVFGPVQSVLDAPASSNDARELLCVQDSAADELDLVGERFAGARAMALHDHDAGQVSPLGEWRLSNHGKDPRFARGDAVACTLRFFPGALGLRSGAQPVNRGNQVGLIALERDQVVSTGFTNGCSGFFCSAAHPR